MLRTRSYCWPLLLKILYPPVHRANLSQEVCNELCTLALLYCMTQEMTVIEYVIIKNGCWHQKHHWEITQCTSTFKLKMKHTLYHAPQHDNYESHFCTHQAGLQSLSRWSGWGRLGGDDEDRCGSVHTLRRHRLGGCRNREGSWLVLAQIMDGR